MHDDLKSDEGSKLLPIYHFYENRRRVQSFFNRFGLGWVNLGKIICGNDRNKTFGVEIYL